MICSVARVFAEAAPELCHEYDADAVAVVRDIFPESAKRLREFRDLAAELINQIVVMVPAAVIDSCDIKADIHFD